jgi:hypothetical protein
MGYCLYLRIAPVAINYDQYTKLIPKFCIGDSNGSIGKELQLSPQIEAFVAFYTRRGLDKMSCMCVYVISTSRMIGNKF